MSQTWFPNTSAELDSDDTLSDSRGYLNNALEALRSSWSGATAPSSPVQGQTFIDTDDNTWQIYNGSGWTTIGDADTAYLGLLPRSAGSSYPLSGALYLGTHQVKGVTDPTLSTDAATKNYVDTYALLKTGGTMTGDIVMGANDVTMDHNPSASTDLARKAYVDLFDPLAGSTWTGNHNAGGYKLTGLGTPTVTSDASTKSYTDGKFDASTGHDHDGVDSKKVDGSKLVAVGASNGAVPYVTSAVCSMIVPWATDYVDEPSIGTAYLDICEVTVTLPSTATKLWAHFQLRGQSSYNYDIRIQDGSDTTLFEDTAWYYPYGSVDVYGTCDFRWAPATTGSYTVTVQIKVNATGTTERYAALMVFLC